jgi:uncharacterized protein (UPF0335 family)
MKYLKSYKIFESNKEIIVSTLRDICLELEDNGFLFNFNSESDDNKIEYVIHRLDYERFRFTDDVSEVLDRIYQYMRELGWYSHLYYNLGGGLEKKFYIRPDGRMRDQSLSWIDKNWPSVLSISFHWYKIYDDKIKESNNWDISIEEFYGDDVINTMKSDISFINDKLIEINDMGYHTNSDFTSMTHAKASKTPVIYIYIENNDFEEFYKDNDKELIDSNLDDITNYMKSNGYEVKAIHDNREVKPIHLSFIKSKTSYQISFIKIS